uniref:Putative secreted protein n=1 Tax=Anopheles darlingi TaxID=43151 RepID=A0A2M4D1F4_ANODA
MSGVTFSSASSSAASTIALLIVLSNGYLPFTGGGMLKSEIFTFSAKSSYVSNSGLQKPLKSSVSIDHTNSPASFWRIANRTFLAMERVLSYTITCDAVSFDLLATISAETASQLSLQSLGLRFSSSQISL